MSLDKGASRAGCTLGGKSWRPDLETESIPWPTSQAASDKGFLWLAGGFLVIHLSLGLSRLEALVNDSESMGHMKQIRSLLQPPRGG